MAPALAYHNAQVGDFALTLVRDSVYSRDGGAMFGVVPKTLWSRKTPADELNRVPLAFNGYVIRTGDRTMESIDTRTHWLTKAVDGNWLCGFGHDPGIAFTAIAHDRKTKFALR